MRCMNELHMQYPFAGSRMMRDLLNRQGHHIGRRHTRTLMKKMGINALYRKPNPSQANQTQRKYPYLLKGLSIQRSNQVWATNITYIPMAKGFVYLCAVIDWHSRKVLVHLPHMMIDTVKINQSLLLLTLLNCNNTADKNTMCAHFLNLLNLTIKAN